MSMYSQVNQDDFVLSLIDDGFYVDIGAGNGFQSPNGGNSLKLEENGWDGILIEGNPAYSEFSKKHRKGKSINCFIPQKSLLSIFQENEIPKIIDYVSIDIEPSSFVALKDFPFSEFGFKVLTYEHDAYPDYKSEDAYQIALEEKEASRKILYGEGYFLLAEDVQVPKKPNYFFEDWWVNPAFFEQRFLHDIQSRKITGQEMVNKISKWKQSYWDLHQQA